MRKLSRLLSLALLLALPLAGARADDLPTLDDVLRKIEAKGNTIKDFRARFKQEKTVYVLDEPIRSEGSVLYLRPGRLRWETERPQLSSLVIDEHGMKVYIPDLHQLEVYDFSGKDALGAILPLFGQSVEDLRRSYDVKLATGGDATLYQLDLVPKNERVRRSIASLEIWFDRETLLPRKLAYHDPNGDSATTVFESLDANVGLDEKAFQLDLPAGTQVKKPLGGLPF